MKNNNLKQLFLKEIENSLNCTCVSVGKGNIFKLLFEDRNKIYLYIKERGTEKIGVGVLEKVK